MKSKYKISKPIFSDYHKSEVVDILKLGKIFWLFPFWWHHDTILNRGQAEEVVYLLNNPDVVEHRVKEWMSKNLSNLL